MSDTPFATDWHALIDPELDGFIATGTMVLDGVFDTDDLTALQHERGGSSDTWRARKCHSW